MEFDKRRIYTCVNADELKIGSKVILVDTLYDLMYKICDPNFDDFSILEKVMPPEYRGRFIGHTKTSVCATNAYLLAYLVEEPKKEEYRSFNDEDEMYSFVVQHNYNWLINKQSNQKALFLGFTNLGKVLVGEEKLTLQQVFEQYDFYDWNNDVRYPCGMKVEC